jgi:hypothetical protein
LNTKYNEIKTITGEMSQPAVIDVPSEALSTIELPKRKDQSQQSNQQPFSKNILNLFLHNSTFTSHGVARNFMTNIERVPVVKYFKNNLGNRDIVI